MFKSTDYLIISIIGLFLGISLFSQYSAGKKYLQLVQPETNEVTALEVAKLTKGNADLRRTVKDLTGDLRIYQTNSASKQSSFEKYQDDTNKLAVINGLKGTHGQGILINIEGALNLPQVVDLVNAIKNIGGEVIAINDQRLVLNTDLSLYQDKKSLDIKVLGNSNLLKTAMTRKGGIIEQIDNKDIKIAIMESSNIDFPEGDVPTFHYARIITE